MQDTTKIAKWGCYILLVPCLILGLTSRFITSLSGRPTDLLLCIGISGLVGLITNTLAIKMILDYIYLPVINIKIPMSGLLPDNIGKLIDSISSQVGQQILTPETIRQEIGKQESFSKMFKSLEEGSISFESTGEIIDIIIAPQIEEEQFFSNIRDRIIKDFAKKKWIMKLANYTGVIDYDDLTYQIIDAIKEKLKEVKDNPETIRKLNDILRHSIKKLTPDQRSIIEKRLLKVLEDFALKNFDIATAVKNKLKDFSPKEIKKKVLELAHDYLGWIEVWGGILGAFVGIIMGIVL